MVRLSNHEPDCRLSPLSEAKSLSRVAEMLRSAGASLSMTGGEQLTAEAVEGL